MASLLNTYENILISTLREYAEMFNQQRDGMEAKVLIDKENKHYQLLNYGFSRGVHECYIIFHFEIKNNKIWVQENRTDILIANELCEKGVAKSHIVLGLQEPELRAFSGYAVA